MKAKIYFFITAIFILGSCGKSELSESTTPRVEIPPAITEVTPVVITEEIPPNDVHGADVTGRAQDMPVGTDNGIEHTSDPTSALTEGAPAPNPSSN